MADSFTSPKGEDVPNPLALLGVTEEPEVFQKPTKPVSLGFQAFLGLANMAFYLTLYPVTGILLPLQTHNLDPKNKVVALGLISTIGASPMLIDQKQKPSRRVFHIWCDARPLRQNNISPMPSMPYTPNKAVWPCTGVVFNPCM